MKLRVSPYGHRCMYPGCDVMVHGGAEMLVPICHEHYMLLKVTGIVLRYCPECHEVRGLGLGEKGTVMLTICPSHQLEGAKMHEYN